MLKKLPPLLLNNRGGCLNLTASVRQFRCCLSVSVNASINHDDTLETVGLPTSGNLFFLPPLSFLYIVVSLSSGFVLYFAARAFYFILGT